MRFFITFKPTSTLKENIMVFQDMDRHKVQDYLVANYGKAWHQIYTEQEFAQLFPNEYCMCKTKTVPTGTETAITVNNKIYTYPDNKIEKVKEEKNTESVFKECA